MTTYLGENCSFGLPASVFRKQPSIYVFSYFPFGFEGRMWDLIVSVPDHCISFYFDGVEQNMCEGLLTEQESAAALKEMKNQKSPGSDVFTTEFCKIFWNDMKQFYINSINFSYQTGKLTELQTQSIIFLLFQSQTKILHF